MSKFNKGFTTTELLMATAIVGVLVGIACVSYLYYIPKSQSVEANNLIRSNQLSLVKNIEAGYCTLGDTDVINGRYGVASIAGTYTAKSGERCLTGCSIQYKFNDRKVSPTLSQRVAVVDMSSDGRIFKNSTKSTLQEKYFPMVEESTTLNSNCSSLIKTPTKTEGENTGEESGIADPTVPTTPTTPVDPTVPVDPPEQSGELNPANPGEPVPNPNGKYNVFFGTDFVGLGNEHGIRRYFYPLDLNNPQELAYFKDNDQNYKAIYFRTAGYWGVTPFPAGYFYAWGSGLVIEQGLVWYGVDFYTNFVTQNGRCPTVEETPPPLRNGHCRMNSSLFTKY